MASKNQIASIEALIKRASKKKNQIYEFSIGSLDGLVVQLKEPSDELIQDAGAMEGVDGWAYLLSEVMVEPNVRDKQLLADMKKEDSSIQGYMDIVKKLFRQSEITTICTALLKESGYSEDNVTVLKKK